MRIAIRVEQKGNVKIPKYLQMLLHEEETIAWMILWIKEEYLKSKH